MMVGMIEVRPTQVLCGNIVNVFAALLVANAPRDVIGGRLATYMQPVGVDVHYVWVPKDVVLLRSRSFGQTVANYKRIGFVFSNLRIGGGISTSLLDSASLQARRV